MSSELNLFLKKSILFLLFFAAFSFCVNFVFANYVMSDSLLNKAQRQFDKFNPEIDTLILGDSHAQRGINPLLLGNAFNFGTTGETYIQTYYKLKYILDTKKKKIKRVVLPLDLHGFTERRSKNNSNIYYWKKYIDPMELGKAQGQPFKYFILYYIKANFFSYTSELGTLISFTNKQKRSFLKRGFRPLIGEYTEVLKGAEGRALKRIDTHFPENENYVDEVLLSYFKKTLDLCLANDIEIIFVKYPVTDLYFKLLKERVKPRKIESRLLEVLKAYPQMPLADYRKVYFAKNQFFYNHDHVNLKGANMLTKNLKQALEKMDTAKTESK